MSGSLCYSLISEKEGGFSCKLKSILDKKFSLNTGDKILTYDDVSYLEGLKDSGIDGADKLIDLLHQHENIRIFIEY